MALNKYYRIFFFKINTDVLFTAASSIYLITIVFPISSHYFIISIYVVTL